MNTYMYIKENAIAILHIYTNALIGIIHCNQVKKVWKTAACDKKNTVSKYGKTDQTRMF